MQFDVFTNPIAATRRAYPLLVVLQSDLAENSENRLVAPIVPRSSLAKVAGRLTPIVTIDSTEHVVLVTALTGIRSDGLRQPVSSLAACRGDLLDAVDYLFFGL